MKQKKEEEQKQKKRYLASTLLDKSFYMKHIFEVWYYLHAEKGFDRIQAYLETQPSSLKPLGSSE